MFKETGPLRYGDKVTVEKLIGNTGLYGVVAEIKRIGKDTNSRYPIMQLWMKSIPTTKI